MHDLLLIPGLGSDATIWSRTIAELDNDARCTIGDTLQDQSITDMAQRILSAAPSRFALAGVSMGGMVALEIMRIEPARVTQLALIECNAFPDTQEQAKQRRQSIAVIRGGIDLRAAGQSSLARLIHPDAIDEIGEEIISMGIRVGAEIYARQIEAVLGRPDQQSVLSTITVPTAIIMGANDAMIPRSCAEAMVAAISDAELCIIANCGHLPPIERPRTTATLLRSLLER
jgi:pimeloyl-ACP methyl ester carboxylesterase